MPSNTSFIGVKGKRVSIESRISTNGTCEPFGERSIKGTFVVSQPLWIYIYIQIYKENVFTLVWCIQQDVERKRWSII